jgi:MoaA/NifB/PqqE/SkfB family radical SAM enzyme
MTPEENTRLMTEEHAARKLVVTNFPTRLTIESTSFCNLRCVMCPHGIDAIDRPRHMPERVLDSLVEAAAVVSQAQLHGIGEPLASPVFWRALESDAFHADTKLSVNTNLTLLNERHLAILIRCRPKLILSVSLDAATRHTYARIRGADLNKVTGNIERLRAARDGRYPMIIINMTLMRENIEEAPAFVELAHSLGVDGVQLWHLNRWPEEVMARYKVDRDGWRFDYAEQGLWNHPQLSNRYLRAAIRRALELGIRVHTDSSKATFFEESGGELQTAVVDKSQPTETQHSATVKECRFPWEWAMITTDGAVRPCCHATAPVGNLRDSGFAKIWNGKEMQDLRRDIIADRINNVCRDAACKFVQNMPRPIPLQDATPFTSGT